MATFPKKQKYLACPGNKRRRLADSFAQDLDPVAYTWWRRHAQESSLLYQVNPRYHQCWLKPEEIQEVYCPLQKRCFYGCLGCGRSHLCSGPEYLTCPHLASPDNPDLFVCPFSGTVLPSVAAMGIWNGSFKRQGELLAALRDMPDQRHLDDQHRTGIRQGKGLSRSLKRRANQSADSGTKKSMMKQADLAEKRARDHAHSRLYEKTTEKNTLRMPLAKVQVSSSSSQPLATPTTTTTTTLSASVENAIYSFLAATEHPGRAEEEALREEQRLKLVQSLNMGRGGGVMIVDKKRKDLEKEEEEEERVVVLDNEEEEEVVPIKIPKSIQKAEERQAKKEERKVLKLVDFLHAHEEGMGGGGGGGGDDNADAADGGDPSEAHYEALTARGILDPLWYRAPTVIPDFEMQEDDAFLENYLAPVVATLDQDPDFSWDDFNMAIKDEKEEEGGGGSPPTSPVSLTQSTSSATASPIIRRPIPPRGGLTARPSKSLSLVWPILDIQTATHDLLPHQRLMEEYIKKFIAHYQPLLLSLKPGQSPPAPLPQFKRYLLFCDRLLWLHHEDTGQRHGPLWPMPPKANFPRLLFTLLTMLLTGPGYVRDPVSDAKIPVWLADPWLTACHKEGLFEQTRAPLALMPRSTVQVQQGTPVNLNPGRQALLSVLKSTYFSPHTMATFLVPHLEVRDLSRFIDVQLMDTIPRRANAYEVAIF